LPLSAGGRSVVPPAADRRAAGTAPAPREAAAA
jgi:hypothetical protein